MDFDYDLELDCGCVVARNHGEWDWDLSSTAECSQGHTWSEAVELADKG